MMTMAPPVAMSVGDLLPDQDDFDQIMAGVDQPAPDAVEDADEALLQVGSLGRVADWSTPEAMAKGVNSVKVIRPFGGRWKVVYDKLGNDHRVLQEDIPLVCDPALAFKDGASQRFIRCPRCRSMPNRGVHSKAGPNGCPAREPRLYTRCDICAANGQRRLIYEDHEPAGLDIPAEEDPSYRDPAQPNRVSREQGLQDKLDDHIRAFHLTIARRRGLIRG